MSGKGKNAVGRGRGGTRHDRRAAMIAVLPMYVFTIAFIIGPLVYMLVLSFMQREGRWGVAAEFTANNYARIAEPVYMATIWQSLRLGITTTVLVALIGYPFGYFMAKLSQKWKNRCMILLIVPFWTSSLMRLYGWMILFRANGPIDKLLMGIGMTEAPLKLLYSWPAVVVGMVYALVPFMIYAVFASAEKLEVSLVEASRDLGATRARAFLTIALPLTMPGLFSGIVLTFIPSMGLFFIADLLGGNKVVLMGNLIQEQLMKAHDWPFASALSIVLMALTSVFLYVYRRATNSDRLEGLV